MEYLNRIIVILFLFTSAGYTVAQNHFTVQVIEDQEEIPLPGVTVLITELNQGSATDANGMATFDDIPDGTYTVRLSFIGFETRMIKVEFPLPAEDSILKFSLKSIAEEIEEITISSTRSSRTIEDIPTRVEFIGGEELAEKGNMKPGDIRMLLNESTGIQTQQTSATSYNSSIRIQGLDGRYTQLLRDGLPLYSGLSGGLSLMQIAPLDLKQVEVIKGASSTLYGGGAIAGLVNLISKTPEDEPELSAMLNATSALGLDASGFFSGRNEKMGTVLFTSYNLGSPYDPADIGLTAIPKFNRITINPKIFIYPNDRTQISGGINWVKENRLGGNVDFIKGEPTVDPYFEDNETNRLSSQFRGIMRLNNQFKIELKNSINHFQRIITLPDYSFSSLEISSFSEFNMTHFSERSETILGLNLWTENFDQRGVIINEPLDFEHAIFGGFAQNTWTITQSWILESGLRWDFHSEYGDFILPRVSLLYKPSTFLTFRVGGGMGYKTPTLFTEETERIHYRDLVPLDAQSPGVEQSTGGNFDINYRTTINEKIGLNLNTLFFYTRIDNPLELVMNNGYRLEQNYDYVDSRGMELNLKWTFGDLKWFIGYTLSDVGLHTGISTDRAPLSPPHRLNNVLMYEKHDNFWLGLEAYYFSSQQLDNPMGVSDPYWIFGVMSEKKLGEKLSIFINFENILDTRQTRMGPIFTGTIDSPEFYDLYAPLDGFVINGGIKWSSGKDHDD